MIPWINTKGTFGLSIAVVICGFALIFFGLFDFVRGFKGDNKDWFKVIIGIITMAIGGLLVVISGASLLATATNLGNSIPK